MGCCGQISWGQKAGEVLARNVRDSVQRRSLYDIRIAPGHDESGETFAVTLEASVQNQG